MAEMECENSVHTLKSKGLVSSDGASAKKGGIYFTRSFKPKEKYGVPSSASFTRRVCAVRDQESSGLRHTAGSWQSQEVSPLSLRIECN